MCTLQVVVFPLNILFSSEWSHLICLYSVMLQCRIIRLISILALLWIYFTIILCYFCLLIKTNVLLSYFTFIDTIWFMGISIILLCGTGGGGECPKTKKPKEIMRFSQWHDTFVLFVLCLRKFCEP